MNILDELLMLPSGPEGEGGLSKLLLPKAEWRPVHDVSHTQRAQAFLALSDKYAALGNAGIALVAQNKALEQLEAGFRSVNPKWVRAHG